MTEPTRRGFMAAVAGLAAASAAAGNQAAAAILSCCDLGGVVMLWERRRFERELPAVITLLDHNDYDVPAAGFLAVGVSLMVGESCTLEDMTAFYGRYSVVLPWAGGLRWPASILRGLPAFTSIPQDTSPLIPNVPLKVNSRPSMEVRAAGAAGLELHAPLELWASIEVLVPVTTDTTVWCNEGGL